MVKVSVIMPVYNGERHLRQCLDSVCGQTLKEIEIICVDDGSTDSSYQILEEYQRGDDRIRLFRQQNQYAGVARNTGKANARGEYLAFWDCDDFFEENALELMYERAKETDADICVCGGYQYDQGLERSVPKPDYMNGDRIPQTDVFNRKTNEDYILNFTNVPVWNKLYRRAFIEDLDLDFQPVRNCNDVYFTVNAMCLAGRVTTVPEMLVHYRREQKQGLVNSVSKSPLSPIRTWMDAADHLIAADAFPERSFVNKALGSIVYLLQHIPEYQAFRSVVELLQSEGLQRLHIREREDGYYYNRRHGEILSHLLHDTPDEFLAFLMYETYTELSEQSARKRLMSQNLAQKRQRIADQKQRITNQKQRITDFKQQIADQKQQIDKLKRNNAELNNKVEKLLRSKAYRIGTAVLWIPRKIMRLFKRKK